MQVGGQAMRTIWRNSAGAVEIIDQTRLPHAVAVVRLASVEDAAEAIRSMQVRGAPLIGATAAYGLALAAAAIPSRQPEYKVSPVAETSAQPVRHACPTKR